MDNIRLGIYRHYKGNLYEVIGFAMNSETLEEMVVYRAMYGERGTWVRPLSMWDNPIEIDGETVKRFEFTEKCDMSEREHELSKALRAITSLIGKCEKVHEKQTEGSSQHTLMKRRLEAFYLSQELIIREMDT